MNSRCDVLVREDVRTDRGGLGGFVFPGAWEGHGTLDLRGLPSARGGREGAFPAIISAHIALVFWMSESVRGQPDVMPSVAPLRKQVSHLILKDPGMIH